MRCRTIAGAWDNETQENGRMVLVLLVALVSVSPIQADQPVQLRFDTSQAEAVLSILAIREAREPVTEEDWHLLFSAEPYQRLKRRETDLQRSFTDESFRPFFLSDELARRADELRQTLDNWRSRDLEASARRVLTYLPPAARIRAAVYPVIKPQTNSFVYDLRDDPAIFLYLDPEQSAAKFENTVAHELHHIGFGSLAQELEAVTASLPPAIRPAVGWMGAFGEGFAMLAAAGDLSTHPHAVSPVEERARWDRDMGNFNLDLRKLEKFFLDIIDGRLMVEEDVRQRAFAFFGEQGPWYTVGYRMAVMVERLYGRPTLIECMLDPRLLLARYNAAAAEFNSQGGEQLALWSVRLLERIGTP
jgi:hypothetical protein